MPEVIQPPGWATPSGYAHGVLARGRVLAIAGQIGAPDGGPVDPGGLVPQFDLALANVATVLKAAAAGFDDVISITIYVTDLAAYRQARINLGEVWRRYAGRRYPAMSLVQVSGLLAEGAEVEVQALAVLA